MRMLWKRIESKVKMRGGKKSEGSERKKKTETESKRGKEINILICFIFLPNVTDSSQ